MDLPDNPPWCCSEEDEGQDVSSVLLYCWLLMTAERLDGCYSIDILIRCLMVVTVLLYCWLSMTAEKLDGCYSIAILIVDDWWVAWWLLQYYYTVSSWWLLITERLDDWCSIAILLVVDDWCHAWWLFDMMISQLLLWCWFVSWLVIDWVYISNDTLMIVVAYCFSIPILMMISMFQHLYADYADDALALVVAEFLALTSWWKLLMLSISLHGYCR